MSSLFFQSQLGLLGGATALASAAAWKRSKGSTATEGEQSHTLTSDYLFAYGLIMAADWLQGPYMFRLLHTEHHFSIGDVASLFVIGFLSAGVASPIVGRLADVYGRRTMCIVACLLYSVDCLMICLPSWTACVIARIAGGAATSILWSVPESWLVTASHDLGISQSSLSKIFGSAAYLNGLVAVIAGIVANISVSYFGTAKAPFRIAIGFLLACAAVISSRWKENKGQTSQTQGASVRSAVVTIFSNRNLISVLLSQTIFETSMYLFVFLWVPSMESLATSVGIDGSNLPLGIIFAAFMCSMMLGSLAYRTASKNTDTTISIGNDEQSTISAVPKHGKIMCALLLVAALGIATASFSRFLQLQFWSFCLFEAMVGVYYPTMAFLKSELLEDDVRATFASLFRLPLNLLVTVALILGAENHRPLVLHISSLALGLASIVVFLLLVQRYTAYSILPTDSRHTKT